MNIPIHPISNTSASGGYLTPTSPLPTSDLPLARQLNDLVAGVSGLPGNMVRPRWQPEPPLAPSATENWAAFGVTRIHGETGGPEIAHHSEAEGHDLTRQLDYLTVLISFYGPNCQDYARLFKDGIFISQNWEAANAVGLNLEEAADVLPFEEQVNNVWYRRADLEVVIKQKIARRYEIMNILSAQGIIHVQGLSGNDVDVSFDTDIIRRPEQHG